MVCFELSHFGHEIFVLLLSTICSYRSPQSSQTYSKIGINKLPAQTTAYYIANPVATNTVHISIPRNLNQN
jgi:hypothetical protein